MKVAVDKQAMWVIATRGVVPLHDLVSCRIDISHLILGLHRNKNVARHRVVLRVAGFAADRARRSPAWRSSPPAARRTARTLTLAWR